ncbi:MAG TPA: diguanylate cyclase [Anaerolineales bacterium]|nr:diguanylate cyclase [Anaerolineales bacterium]
MVNKPFAMIIEDDRDTVALFRHVLDFAGYKTEIILRGEKALERLSVVTPDVILLDLNLPGVSGTKILEIIHEDPRLADIPVIVITGHSHMALGLQSQTDLILLKPVSVDQLTNLILRLRPVDPNIPVEPPRDPLTKLYNRAFFISRLGYSIERAQQLDGGVFGILFIDFDNFSMVQKERGKEFGDKILTTTADFLRSVIRPIDTIARFSYDHFLIQIEELSTKDILTKIAERIQKNLCPHIKEELGIDICINIGMVFCDSDYLWAEDIIRDVDIALHIAKEDLTTNIASFNAVKHGSYRSAEIYPSILRIGLSPGDPTKPRTEGS